MRSVGAVRLCLRCCSLNDEVLAVLLVPMGSLPKLASLDLRLNQIGDAGISEFSRQIASGSLPALQNVFLHGNPGDVQLVTKALASRKK